MTCLNGGKCINDPENHSFICDCTNTGYEGKKCEKKIDPCENKPCYNG